MGRTALRAVTAVYTLIVTWLMLWPNLQGPDIPVQRPDLVAHFGVFGLLTLLVIACRLFAERAISAANIARSGVLCASFATLTELGQGLPFINRVFDPMDAMCNALGVLGAVAACCFLAALADD